MWQLSQSCINNNKNLPLLINDCLPYYNNTSLLNKTMTVYELKCDDGRAKYVAETSRYLSATVREHRREFLLCTDSSVIAIHCTETGHVFNFNELKILPVESKLNQRLFLEMVYISGEY